MRLGFLVLIGLPGSGKTTLAKTLLENFGKHSDNLFQFIHVDYDELIRFPNENYKCEWKLARNSLSGKIEQLAVALKNKSIDLCPPEFRSQFDTVSSRKSDIVLILDDNMYFKSMRYSIFQIARKHNIGFCQVFLNCTLEKALLKNSCRRPESVVHSDVIENMHSKMEPPSHRNYWEKYSIELNALCNLNELLCKIYPVLKKSLTDNMYKTDNTEMRELSQIQCKKSVLHQTDIVLRRIINFKIKNHFRESPSDNFKECIAHLQCRKSELLSDIKAGIICLPEEVLNEIGAATLEKFQLMRFLSSYF